MKSSTVAFRTTALALAAALGPSVGVVAIATAATAPVAVRIEAEGFSTASGVSTERTADTGGGENVGYIQAGDSITYSGVNLSTGVTSVKVRLAAATATGGVIQIRTRSVTGPIVGSVAVPTTGGWQTWQTVTANLTQIVPGAQTLALTFTANSATAGVVNLNWIEFLDPGTETTPSPAVRIEAEACISSAGVATEATTDTGGGQDVGYIQAGDWMTYSAVNLSTGVSTVRVRVAAATSAAAGGVIQIRTGGMTGPIVGSAAVPITGGWQTWQTVTAKLTQTISGTQTLALTFTANSASAAVVNLNWLEFASASTTTPPATPTPTPTTTPPTAAARGLAWYQTNTGVPAGTALAASAGMTITTAGTVIENRDITGNITVNATNVTIRNSRIAGLIRSTAGGLIVDHVELNGTNISTADRETYPAVTGPAPTIRYAKIHDYAQGLGAGNGTTVTDSYIYGLRSAGQHAEPILSNGGDGMVFSRNWLDSTDTNAHTHVSAALALYGDFGQIRNVVIDGNYLVGAGYLTYTGASTNKPYPVPYNVAYTNNTFDTSAPNCYGPVDPSPLDALSVSKWAGNVRTNGTVVLPPRTAG